MKISLSQVAGWRMAARTPYPAYGLAPSGITHSILTRLFHLIERLLGGFSHRR